MQSGSWQSAQENIQGPLPGFDGRLTEASPQIPHILLQKAHDIRDQTQESDQCKALVKPVTSDDTINL